MIKTLIRPSLKEWTTVQALKPVYPTHSFFRCRRVVFTTPSPPKFEPFLLTSLSTTRFGAAHYSTLPNEADVKTKVDAPLPSTSSPARKHKFELRPAPKKLKQEAQVTLPPRPAIPDNNAGSLPISSSTTVPPKATSPTPGPLEATQHDISDATKHGILSPPPEGATRVGRFWHQMKQLFWFYWGGLKMIFITHRKQARAIRQRVNEAKARGEEGVMTRWETRFLRTYKRDLIKLVPFVLTLIVLEEALPLIVLYAPGLLPSTCLLPSQRQRIEAKRREKQMKHAASAIIELERLKIQHRDIVPFFKQNAFESLTGELVRAVSGLFARPTWGPLFLQRRRVTKHLARISADDALLVEEGMGSRLKDEELVEALEERGIILQSRTSQCMQEKLQRWLKDSSDDGARLGLVLQSASGTYDTVVKVDNIM